MKILILDDQPTRHEVFARRFQKIGAEVVHAYTADQAADALANNHFDVAYLDHDLHECHYGDASYEGAVLSGFHTAELIAKLPPPFRPNRVVIHSWAVVGAQRMLDVLVDAGVQAEIVRFSKAEPN